MSCLQPVGVLFDGRVREYRQFRGDDGEQHTFCADSAACERRWQDVVDSEKFAAAEARIWDPEPGDDEL
jgi:hypothetical protein